MGILTAVLFSAALLLSVERVVLVPYNAPGIDFGKHYHAAWRVIAGESPYTGERLFLSFNYPQFVAWCNVPLALFRSEKAAEKAWDAFNVILVLFTLGVAVLGYRPRKEKNPLSEKGSMEQKPASSPELTALFTRRWWVLAAFLTFFFTPAMDGLLQGNLSPWVLFSITLLGWVVYRDREEWTGVLIILCALIKLMPILLLIPYLLAWRKRVLRGAALTFACYLLLLIGTGAIGNEWYYITRVIPGIGSRWAHVSYSIPYAFSRYFLPSLYENTGGLKWISIAWDLILVGSYVLVCLKLRGLMKERWGRILLFIIGVLLLPLLPPLLEYLHFNWCFPGLLLTALLGIHGVIRGGDLFAALAGFFLLALCGPAADVIAPGRYSFLAFAPVIALFLYILFIRIAWNYYQAVKGGAY